MRSAPTRTAARLNNGDTCQGAWSLPWGSCLGPGGRIADDTLKRLKLRVKGKEEVSVDEISMLSPENCTKSIAKLVRPWTL